jgi:hypothetical protein
MTDLQVFPGQTRRGKRHVPGNATSTLGYNPLGLLDLRWLA